PEGRMGGGPAGGPPGTGNAVGGVDRRHVRLGPLRGCQPPVRRPGRPQARAAHAPALPGGAGRGGRGIPAPPLRGRRDPCPRGRLVPDFYELMTGAVARWASRQHEPLWLARRRLRHRDPLEKFEAVARVLGDRCHLWLARVDGRPVAANVVLQGTNAYGFRA